MSVDEQGTKREWIYGVVPGGAALGGLERLDDDLPEVWIVESGGLGAIVGPAPEGDARATRKQVLAHARVLEAAVADAPVVPFRFGVMVPGGDEEVGRDLLDAQHDQLSALLARVERFVQMTVKVSYREDVLLRELLESEPEIANLREVTRHGPEEALRNERIRLGELIGTAVEARRQRDAAEIVQALGQVSAAVAPDQLEQEYMVLNEAFLIERDRQGEFEEALERAAEERIELMRFRLLGPLPAYNFIDMEQTAWA